jgi:hypothetical protein
MTATATAMTTAAPGPSEASSTLGPAIRSVEGKRLTLNSYMGG